jgi:hypothetical protein
LGLVDDEGVFIVKATMPVAITATMMMHVRNIFCFLFTHRRNNNALLKLSKMLIIKPHLTQKINNAY